MSTKKHILFLLILSSGISLGIAASQISLNSSYSATSSSSSGSTSATAQNTNEKRIALYEAALKADQKSTQTLCMLGYCHLTGTGVSRDLNQALSFYNKALETDVHCAAARCGLGCCYAKIGSEESLAQAVTFWKLASSQGSAHACFELFIYFLHRSRTQNNNTSKNQDLWQALLALEKAQKIGDHQAQKIYAELTKRSNCYPSATISLSEAILLLDLSQEIRSHA